MSNEAALAIAKEFIDIMNVLSEGGIVIDKQLSDLMFGRQGVWYASESHLDTLQRIMSAAKQGNDNRFNSLASVGLFMNNTPSSQAQRKFREDGRFYENPFTDFRILRVSKASLSAVETLQQQIAMQKRLIRRWNEEIRKEAIKRVGHRRVWGWSWTQRLVDYTRITPSVEEWRRRKNKFGTWAVWFIGLPGSGKTTLAASLYLFLCGFDSAGPLAMIDGDMVRKRDVLWAPAHNVAMTVGGTEKGRDFSTAKRRSEAIPYAQWVAKIVDTWIGVFVLGSTCFPLTEQRIALRDALKGRLFLVWVNTPKSACEKRRPNMEQGPYSGNPQFRDGSIDGFEPPHSGSVVPADLEIDTSSEPLYLSIERLVLALEERGFLRAY